MREKSKIRDLGWKIVMAELLTWDYPCRVGSHHYAGQFRDAGCKILWVNQFLHPLNFMKKSAALLRSYMGRSPGMEEGGLFTYTPFSLLPYAPYPVLSAPCLARRCLRWTFPRMSKVLIRSSFSAVDVLWITNPRLYSLVDLVEHRVLAYRVCDYYAGFSNAPRSIASVERELIERADIVFAVSHRLVDEARSFSKNVVYLPNGVDGRRFSDSMEEPADLAAIPRPRAVYVGIISGYFDQDLVLDTADKAGDFSFVLIGPNDVDLSILETRPNIYLLGPRPFETIPAYLKHCDVGIMPFVKSSLTDAISPIKLLEYFAAGLPVVAADLHETREMGSPARLVLGARQFVDGLHGAVREGSPESCIGFASRHEWSARFEQVVRLLCPLLEKEGRRP